MPRPSAAFRPTVSDLFRLFPPHRGLALIALMLTAASAGAQGMAEYGMITSQGARTLTTQPGVIGPDWGASRRRGALTDLPSASPKSKTIRGRRAPAPPPLLAKPPSGAPGKVAGLVYEYGTKAPVANVTVALVSNDPGYVVTTLTARTDSAGYYEFAKVEPGRWILTVPRDGLPMQWSLPRARPPVTLAKKQSYAAPAFALGKQTCVEGHAVWADGYTLYDAPVTVVPLDTLLAASGGQLNGIGDYRVCEAANDSVMVWMHLRDGRSLGRATRLTPGTTRRIEFKPDPLEKMEGSSMRVLAVLSDGRPVPKAQVLVVGRRFEQGDRPALVFVREDVTNADGVAEFKAPFGNYEVLVINPREGQTGSERIVVDTNQATAQEPLRVVLRGSSTPPQQLGMKYGLLDRAETSLYVWGQ